MTIINQTVKLFICDNKNMRKSCFGSEQYQSLEQGIRDGWRISDEKVYCPYCVKKEGLKFEKLK